MKIGVWQRSMAAQAQLVIVLEVVGAAALANMREGQVQYGVFYFSK